MKFYYIQKRQIRIRKTLNEISELLPVDPNAIKRMIFSNQLTSLQIMNIQYSFLIYEHCYNLVYNEGHDQ